MFTAYNDQQTVILSVIALFVIGGPLFVLFGGVVGYLFRKAEMTYAAGPKLGRTTPA